MIRSMLILLVFVSSLLAQFPYTNWEDTTTYTSFKADSLKFGNIVNLTSSSANALVCMVNDTNVAGYAADTAKLIFGYRLGRIVINASGKKDTSWDYKVRAGSFSTLPADTAGKWTTKALYTSVDSTTGDEIPLVGVMDTVHTTGFAVTCAKVNPCCGAALMQPWIMGLSGNRTNGWIKVRTQFTQLKYLPTRQQ